MFTGVADYHGALRLVGLSNKSIAVSDRLCRLRRQQINKLNTNNDNTCSCWRHGDLLLLMLTRVAIGNVMPATVHWRLDFPLSLGRWSLINWTQASDALWEAVISEFIDSRTYCIVVDQRPPPGVDVHSCGDTLSIVFSMRW